MAASRTGSASSVRPACAMNDLDAAADHIEIGCRAGDADAGLQAGDAEHHGSGGMQPPRGRELRGGDEHIRTEEVAVGRH
jgi:hypothetical protein